MNGFKKVAIGTFICILIGVIVASILTGGVPGFQDAAITAALTWVVWAVYKLWTLREGYNV